MVEETIGKRLAQIRKSRNITQDELSEAIEVTPNYLSSVERGKYMLTLDKLVRAMNVLQCGADELFYEVVEHSCSRSASDLVKRIENLPKNEREWVLHILDMLLQKTSG